MAERLLSPNTVFDIAPADLLIAKRQIPMDGGYVPLRFFNRAFRFERPILESLGEGVVALSMSQPFGFMRPTDENNLHSTVLQSQMTESILLKPSPTQPNEWETTVDTPKPLSELDRLLFKWGVSFYAEHAAARLHSRVPNIALDPIPPDYLPAPISLA